MGGGKGTWGTVQDQIRLVNEEQVCDKGDPNFDETKEKAIFTSKTWHSMEVGKKKFKSVSKNLNNFKKAIKGL